MKPRNITILNTAKVACIVLPLLSFFLAATFKNLYITYSVVPITMIAVSFLFYCQRKYEKGFIFSQQKHLILLFGLALVFFVFS